MQGAPRRQVRSSARSVFLLPLVLALLALVAFPVFAHAAGIPEYELEESGTHIHREPVKPKPNETQPSSGNEAHKKAKGSEAEGATGPTEPSEEEESSQGTTGGGTSEGGGGNKPGGESGNGGNKPAGGAEAEGKIGPGKEVAAGGTPEATATPVASQSTSSGGGSSPVVPILIAVVVLAAISIGVVIYRQRKGGTGQDGRVSSPNAS